MRVLAALSGGVDSAVAAARVVEAGHDVVAVHLALSRSPATNRNGSRGCCTLDDARDARRIADVLGIPFYLWDMAEAFERDVITDFIAEYEAGRTPNPCVRCNEHIKFAAVLDRALALGFDAVCTGHYARIVDSSAGRTLHRAVDPDKDQSYVLAVLDPIALSHVLLPIGDTPKGEVRAEAERRGLLVAAKPDSHDICFIPDGDTAGWLRERLGDRPGQIVDVDSGVVVGEHSGSYAFTIGQRRGLSLSNPGADGQPRYVLAIEPVSGRVSVGPRERLAVARITATSARWPGSPAVPGEGCTVQVRAHGSAVPALVSAVEPDLVVELREPQFGVAAGQTLVLYRDDQVIGGATITDVTVAVTAHADH
jgi:tRNA-specific 2-thiouridylase